MLTSEIDKQEAQKRKCDDSSGSRVRQHKQFGFENRRDQKPRNVAILEAGKGKEMDSPPDSPEGSPVDTLNLAQKNPVSDSGLQNLRQYISVFLSLTFAVVCNYNCGHL